MKISQWAFAFGLLFLGECAFAGGVSGGGGNLLHPIQPREPMPTSEVFHEIESMQGRLVVYFEGKLEEFREGELPVEERELFGSLFRLERNVIDLAASTSLLFNSDAPCMDLSESPVDASTVSLRANSICVSSFSISHRVDPKILGAESAAILAHEFSELAGFDESQAVRLQAAVFADYKKGAF
jgi:hypothetical protein